MPGENIEIQSYMLKPLSYHGWGACYLLKSVRLPDVSGEHLINHFVYSCVVFLGGHYLTHTHTYIYINGEEDTREQHAINRPGAVLHLESWQGPGNPICVNLATGITLLHRFTDWPPISQSLSINQELEDTFFELYTDYSLHLMDISDRYLSTCHTCIFETVMLYSKIPSIVAETVWEALGSINCSARGIFSLSPLCTILVVLQVLPALVKRLCWTWWLTFFFQKKSTGLSLYWWCDVSMASERFRSGEIYFIIFTFIFKI